MDFILYEIFRMLNTICLIQYLLFLRSIFLVIYFCMHVFRFFVILKYLILLQNMFANIVQGHSGIHMNYSKIIYLIV